VVRVESTLIDVQVKYHSTLLVSSSSPYVKEVGSYHSRRTEVTLTRR
jgi:hypothetical protein